MSRTYSDPALEIDTERVCIRPLCESDEALYCELYTSAETMRFIGPTLSSDRAKRSFRKALVLTRNRPVEYSYLAVREKSTGHAIGICSIQRVDMTARRAETGIMLLSRWRARGLATEALTALIGYVFSALRLSEVRAEFSADNLAVKRLFLRIGFARCEAGRTHRSSAQEAWSVRREAWYHKATIGKGEDCAERDRLS